MGIQRLLIEMEHQLDRSVLYQDPPSKAHFEVMVAHWISELRNDDTYQQGVEAGLVEACLDHEGDLSELRAALADAEARIRQAKEIL